MNYNKLGSTGLPVSSIGFGTMNLGYLDKTMAFSLLDKTHDLGITLLDTASGYGKSEEILGEWFASSGSRDDFVINTKVGWPTDSGIYGQGLNNKHLSKQLHKTMTKLDTNYIDIYQLHYFDGDQDLLSLVKYFSDLVSNQSIGVIGAPTFTRSYQIVAWYLLAQQYGLHQVGSKLMTTSLLSRGMYDGDTRHIAKEYGLGLITFGSLGGGLLTGRYHSKEPYPEGGKEMMRKTVEAGKIDGLVDRLREIAKEHDTTPAKLSLAWVLDHDFMDSVIIGATRPEQLEDILTAQELKLDDSVYNELTELSNQYKLW